MKREDAVSEIVRDFKAVAQRVGMGQPMRLEGWLGNLIPPNIRNFITTEIEHQLGGVFIDVGIVDDQKRFIGLSLLIDQVDSYVHHHESILTTRLLVSVGVTTLEIKFSSGEIWNMKFTGAKAESKALIEFYNACQP